MVLQFPLVGVIIIQGSSEKQICFDNKTKMQVAIKLQPTLNYDFAWLLPKQVNGKMAASRRGR